MCASGCVEIYDVTQTHSKAIPHPVKRLRSDAIALFRRNSSNNYNMLLGQQRMPVAQLIELKEKCMGGSGISTPGLIKLNHGKSLIALTFLLSVSVSK